MKNNENIYKKFVLKISSFFFIYYLNNRVRREDTYIVYDGG